MLVLIIPSLALAFAKQFAFFILQFQFSLWPLASSLQPLASSSNKGEHDGNDRTTNHTDALVRQSGGRSSELLRLDFQKLEGHWRQPLRRHRPGPKGSVMVAEFELDGQKFTALNGGPRFKFTEAISLVVNCEDQAEVDTTGRN
jgi:hypothetical protein